MNDTVEITTINLKVGERDIPLTIEEAKKIQTALNELFKEKIVHEPYLTRSPKPYEITPTIPWDKFPTNPPQWPVPEWDKNKIWCKSDTLNVIC